MDRRERINDPEEVFRSILDDAAARLWCQLPGIIDSFDAEKMTASVQPAIKAKVTDKAGKVTDVELPLLTDCPVIFPSGGGFTLTFPIAEGDECVVFFADRCIDAWWQSGGTQAQVEFRLHDLSDGFVMVGPRSQANLVSDISTDSVQLRSDDGTCSVELTNDGKIKMTAPGGVEIIGPTLKVNGVTVSVP